MSEEDRKRLDDLFNVALVLITVLGAAEFGFVAVVSNDISTTKYFFWIFTYPIVTLIMAWMLKEFISVHVEVLQDTSHVRTAKLVGWFYGDGTILLTEFCWYFWAIILYYFLNFFLAFVTGSINWLLVGLTLIVWGCLVFEIKFAYVRALERSLYSKRKSWGYFIVLLSLSMSIMFLFTRMHFA
ncbi:MAG: hypothetical protein WCD81_11485 [Candidatus Bathyarchaeia archaeon]